MESKGWKVVVEVGVKGRVEGPIGRLRGYI